MQHFSHLEPATLDYLFHRPPEQVDESSDMRTRALALGATLYIPATRPGLVATVTKRAAEGSRSMVLDLEDAVADADLDIARAAVIAALDELADTPPDAAVFVRVRTEDDMHFVCDRLGPGLEVLTGFVLPKFRPESGEAFLRSVSERSAASGRHLVVMPVVESPEVVYRESRDDELIGAREVLGRHRDSVLAVRIGATDMSSAFGIRRDRDLTIYDVRVVADTIGAVVNHLGRSDGTGFVVTGPVWEYFADHERLFRPMLRATPFAEHDAVRFRQQLVSRDIDGLLREVALDRANGLHGKTVIHPSHVAAVHSLSVVTHEEYQDAQAIASATRGGGVMASGYGNKMNEIGPHRPWAEQTLRRAAVFGVTAENVSFVDVMQALARPRGNVA
ncbi:ATP/GTP-binding protein [Rhodococcus sp. Leaf7]|uniref:HpcH/HpaI aldolase/citrate lyase family protein n=1 Tax=unclassified Rhodococcus (in: high G+C Gram-positive bacteria) TaxID=192944 RepID=UPI000700A022|nr:MULTISPECIES: HpcH/HpaI aldolase/citrate lyase family protein [unclassified Rhodococcus (in: high G+C Gram-positive bacteria)]KQU04533.1 ATP/GTP-binding protein [Rhodococcus sp. Leaf7]KQU40718.1 ATP/GTP-binding protein [Rhodococcus sp. Leaf247]